VADEKTWSDFLEELKTSRCAALYPGSNLVVGRGSTKPRIVFIGEAPGAEEDRLKMPFVGRSGQMLDSWIAACNLKADDFYICNVMKTRPPENRDPTPDEVDACSPLLHKQLNLLRPVLIVAVGRFAMNFFLPNEKSILKASGRLHEALGWPPVFVIPHPSYFLRNGGKGWEPYVEELRKILSNPLPAKQTKLV
jgi:DNA polymerase